MCVCVCVCSQGSDSIYFTAVSIFPNYSGGPMLNCHSLIPECINH